MTESVLITLEAKVLPSDHPVLAGPRRSHRQAYEFENGSVIVTGGLDNPEKLFSTEYDTVSVFESTEASENDWESLHRALRNGKMGFHQALADCNPASSSHWLNQRASTSVAYGSGTRDGSVAVTGGTRPRYQYAERPPACAGGRSVRERLRL
jgi:hypothetical protein